jgi:hypothetical protein
MHESIAINKASLVQLFGVPYPEPNDPGDPNSPGDPMVR